MLNKIMVNGEMWTVNDQYRFGTLAVLDVFTSIRIYPSSFSVYYNDIKGATGATVYGDMNPWGPPLPNSLYMNLYVEAPGRWSSGLSMTGLFANFDYNSADDWESISPSTMWWVKDTPNSAFKNPTYKLYWDNRITKPAPKALGQAGGLPMLSARTAQLHGEVFKHTAWTLEKERQALVEVDRYTATMRKRLFAKMAADGAILRKAGESKPKEGLGAAELDVMKYPGERPDHLRVEQQMMFRKEWKVLTPVQRKAMLGGVGVGISLASNNAVSPDMMCKQCMDGSPECAAQGITKEPTAGVTWIAVDSGGKSWSPADRKTECHKACLPERPVTPVICKCWCAVKKNN